MKKILFPILLGITCIVSGANATTKPQRIGLMGGGAVIGALAAGPIGAVLGVALGDLFWNRESSGASDDSDHELTASRFHVGPFNEDGEVSIYFATASDNLSSNDKKLLQDVAAVIREHPDFRLYVVGAADPRGKNGFDNVSLSNRRANVVKSYLTDHENLADDRILTKGVGPIDAAEKTDENYKKLRIAKLKLVNMPDTDTKVN